MRVLNLLALVAAVCSPIFSNPVPIPQLSPRNQPITSCGPLRTFTVFELPSGNVSNPVDLTRCTDNSSIAQVSEDSRRRLQEEGVGILPDRRVVVIGSQPSCYNILDNQQFPFGKGVTDDPLRLYFSVSSNENSHIGQTLYIGQLDGVEVEPGKIHNGCVLVNEGGRVVGDTTSCGLSLFVGGSTSRNTTFTGIDTVTVQVTECTPGFKSSGPVTSVVNTATSTQTTVKTKPAKVTSDCTAAPTFQLPTVPCTTTTTTAPTFQLPTVPCTTMKNSPCVSTTTTVPTFQLPTQTCPTSTVTATLTTSLTVTDTVTTTSTVTDTFTTTMVQTVTDTVTNTVTSTQLQTVNNTLTETITSTVTTPVTSTVTDTLTTTTTATVTTCPPTFRLPTATMTSTTEPCPTNVATYPVDHSYGI